MESDKLTTRLATLSPAKRALLELKLQQGRGGVAGSMIIPCRDSPSRPPSLPCDLRSTLVGTFAENPLGSSNAKRSFNEV
jgi:hypothetical protein